MATSAKKKPARRAPAKTTPIPTQLAPASVAAALAEKVPAAPAPAEGKTETPAGKVKPAAPPKAQKAGKPAKQKAAKPAKPAAPKAASAPKQPADDKTRKPKLVRDSFTIPKTEYAVLDALKQRAARLGRPAKKSEVLRAGVQALAAMNDAAFLACVGSVPAVKTGRPAKA